MDSTFYTKYIELKPDEGSPTVFPKTVGGALLDILGKRIKWLILPLHESETDRHLIGLSG